MSIGTRRTLALDDHELASDPLRQSLSVDDQRQDAVRLQPVMFVRIRAAHAQATQVREELLRRGARIFEEDVQADRIVVRAEARLADLIGYTKFLREATNESAELWTWLVRYETGT